MASSTCETNTKNFNHCGPTMLPDAMKLLPEAGPGHPSVDMMHHADAAHAVYANGHGSGSFVGHTSKPGPGDMPYGSDGPCFVYGMCPMPVPTEGWERMVGEAGGKEIAERKIEEGIQLTDYMYQYHVPGYLPYSHLYTASPQHMFPPDAATAPPASPMILLTPATSSPSSTKSIPNSLTSLKNEGEEVLEGSGTKSYEEMNGRSPPVAAGTGAPQPPLHAIPQPVPFGGAYPYPFLDDKAGVIGGDSYWYSLANGHIAADPSTPMKTPLYYSCMHQEPAAFMPTTPSYIPDTSVIPPTPPPSISSIPQSAIPFSPPTQSLVLKKSVFKSDDILFYNHYQHLNLPMDMFGKPHLLTSTKSEGKLCVEDLWVKHMRILFKHLPDKWVLSPLQPNRKISSKWFAFRDVAKVRFYCKGCNDGWTSMYGVVVFHYRWNKKMLQGQIMYRVAGQKCSGSCSSEWFEMPLWYPEEAQKVITNLYYKIASQYYNLVTPQYIRTRRYGRPAAHHNRNLCEGCISGLCKMDPVASKVSVCE
ncbi:uncharacterized protein LOC123501602 isoform X2 [Portunus trituberculatus]|uniref:uncharacterized protein LOC123501602 isoform X2 n=1 Tax=Portunus trituberculatus TaxID=210409 RepID=UPI001E1CFED1|nr:uncharacterized protein LOC123501602 isoform X2 [Portunus trituberculatus]